MQPSLLLTVVTLLSAGYAINRHALYDILDTSFDHGLRDTSTLLNSLKAQIAHGKYATHKLLAQLENAHRWFALSLGDTQRRRLQVESRHDFVEEDPYFEDLGNAPLSQEYIIVDPLVSPGSSWQRGAAEMSKYAKIASIIQTKSWSLETPSLLLKASGQYGPDNLMVGVKLRPLGSNESAAGIVYAYENDRNYHSVILDENRPSSCSVSILRMLKGKARLISEGRCHPDSSSRYRELVVQARPSKASVWVDGLLVTNITFEQPVNAKGSIGLICSKGSNEFSHLIAGEWNTTYTQSLQATPSIGPFLLEWSVVSSNDHHGEAEDYNQSQIERQSHVSRSSGKDANATLTCYEYMPDVPKLNSFEWGEDSEEWRLVVPSSSSGAIGHDLPMPALRRLSDVHTNNPLSVGILKDWSCRAVKFRVRLIFLSDGEAGVVIRHQSANDSVLILIESLSQKVHILRLKDSQFVTMAQVKSSIPVIAHESIILEVADAASKLEVSLNGEMILEAPLDGIPAQAGRRIGVVVKRGNVAFAGFKVARIE